MIIIYTQNWDGKFKKSSFELVSYGYELAKKIGTEAVALTIGEIASEELKKLSNYGAEKIISIQNDNLKTFDSKNYTDIISEIAKKIEAKLFLFAHNNQGKAIASRIAAKFNAGIVTSITQMPKSTAPFVISKKVYTGKAIADVKIISDIKVLTLSQNSFGLHENIVAENIETINVEAEKTTIELIEQNKVSGKVLLTDAEIVVSGGRGMKSPDNWKPIEELAEILNAGTACSRPVSDEGWRPHTEHVGQTGKIIAPNLYFAFGISGAIQHIGGVSNSKCIVAINTDKEAPIFEAADYGIVGDVHKILPELIDEIKNIKT